MTTRPIDDVTARRLVAHGVVAGDVSRGGVARAASVPPLEAEIAIERCRALGLIGPDGLIPAPTSESLVGDLGPSDVARVHIETAQHLVSIGTDSIDEIVSHAKSAATVVPAAAAALLDRAGRSCLTSLDYAAATHFLEAAGDIDVDDDPVIRGHRLCDLATALDGIGQIDRARNTLTRAVALGEQSLDPGLLVRAAVAYAYPVEWSHGDRRAASYVNAARSIAQTTDQRASALAASALIEMRMPVPGETPHQVSWVTRSTVGQVYADEAITLVDHCSPEVAALALQTWRSCHSGPSYLQRRFEISAMALDSAQRANHNRLLVESAVWHATDALESGNRTVFEDVVNMARWVAERDGNPRLLWHAYLLSATAAHLEGSVDKAEEFRRRAAAHGRAINSPLWFGGNQIVRARSLFETYGPNELQRFAIDESSPLMSHAITQSIQAGIHLRLGNRDVAQRLTQTAIRWLESEASLLFVATRCAEVVIALGDKDSAGELVAVLEPWASHVSTHSYAWWCDGPVATWLGALHLLLGETEAASKYAMDAADVIDAIGDKRSQEHLAKLQQSLARSFSKDVDETLLTDREVRILTMIAQGLTNPQIAQHLAFSLGTIRAETMSIYRKLGAKGRSDAVVRAVSLGLVDPSPVD